MQQPGRLAAGQLGGGGAVQVDRGARMLLQIGRRHRAIDLSLDRAAHDRGLVLAGRQERDLAGLHDRAHAHRDRFLWNVLGAEEVGRGDASRDGVQGDEPGSGGGAGARLVESDVPGLPDAQDLEVDATDLRDRPLVLRSVRFHLGSRDVPARDVHPLGIDVHVLEQVLPHEPVVAVEALRGHRVVLVQVEGDHLGEIEALVAMEADQLAVDPHRSRSGGQTQDGRAALGAAGADDLGHAARHEPRQVVIGLLDHDGNAFRSFAHAGSIGPGGHIWRRRARSHANTIAPKFLSCGPVARP